MPSECEYPRPLTEGGKPQAADLIDEFFEYRLAYGSEPESWRHFRYGMAHLARHRARVQLAIGEAARIAQDTKGEQFEKFHRRLCIEAGFTRLS